MLRLNAIRDNAKQVTPKVGISTVASRFRGALTISVMLSSALTISAVSIVSTPTFAANSCESIFDLSIVASIPLVVPAKISEEKFQSSTLDLRATLSGKLATVWRSEWKTKLQVQSSNSYVMNLVKTFLTPESQAIVLNGLNPSKEEFVSSVHERMYQLQKDGKLQAGDEILVRDPPAPPGAIDRTFTYYTKPIVSTGSDGKHQIRIRNYLRQVQLDQIPLAQSVAGYDMSGRQVNIQKIGDNSFQLSVKEGSHDTSTKVNQSTPATVTSEQLHERFGPTIYLFAPHGKNFKLEVKTALTDEISGSKFALLGGQHMVQKLDMNLTMQEVVQLFAPFATDADAAARQKISLARLKVIADNANAQPPEAKARIEAVLSVLAEGVNANPDFLTIEGATLYNRTAFESKSGFQSTIDREQGVFAKNMYGAHGLKSPGGTMLMNSRLHTGVEDARHVELKVPVTVVSPMIGIDFHGQSPSLPTSTPEQQASILRAIGIYYPYVLSAAHSGKFNYMIHNHARDRDDAMDAD